MVTHACPDCRFGRAELAPVTIRSVPALRCVRCGGLWFGAGDFARFVAGDAPNPVLPAPEVSEADYTAQRRPHRRRRCPACRRSSLQAGRLGEYRALRCTDCRGYFVRGGGSRDASSWEKKKPWGFPLFG